ncbi:MAG TPA: cobalt-precorrin-6A reductase [Candidatus Competibacteraceae bacterium]|nr:cobalt-precorrin-6A reductase [Candidatus Competibacteraceae bacterium]
MIPSSSLSSALCGWRGRTRILLLGGIGEARRLAERLATAGWPVIYSLAGKGRTPADLPCPVRSGGFGGAAGLATYLRQQNISLLIDATHPYATAISGNAAAAARAADIPLWAYRRPAWTPGPGDDWREVADWPALLAALEPFHRPLFTSGLEALNYPVPAHQRWTVRCLTPQPPAPRRTVIVARGPFALDHERALLAGHDVLVSKNSGGALEAKLQAARELGRPVLMLARPALPAADIEFADIDALLARVFRDRSL